MCFDTRETLMLEDRGGTFLPPQRRGKLTDWEWSDNESALVVVCVGGGGTVWGEWQGSSPQICKSSKFWQTPQEHIEGKGLSSSFW